MVELVEQRGLNITTNIVGCAPDDVRVDVRVDMPEQLMFKQLDAGVDVQLFGPG